MFVPDISTLHKAKPGNKSRVQANAAHVRGLVGLFNENRLAHGFNHKAGHWRVFENPSVRPFLEGGSAVAAISPFYQGLSF
jgi:hypothetical protein